MLGGVEHVDSRKTGDAGKRIMYVVPLLSG
jgi:hypothetical protein